MGYFSDMAIEVVDGAFPTEERFRQVLAEAEAVCIREYEGFDNHTGLMEMHGTCMYLRMYADLLWDDRDAILSILVGCQPYGFRIGPLSLPEVMFEAANRHFLADMDNAYDDFDVRMGWE